MVNKGVPRRDSGLLAEAYKRAQYEDLKRLYLERETYISISSRGEFR
jgi:hypothetical protein